MSDLPTQYAVKVTFNDDGDAIRLAELFTEAFSRGAPTTAMPSAIRGEGHEVTVEFERLDAEHAPGPVADAPQPPGQSVVSAVEELQAEPTALLPAVRALIAVNSARVRAGLSARQRVIIEIEPAPSLTQEDFDVE